MRKTPINAPAAMAIAKMTPRERRGGDFAEKVLALVALMDKIDWIEAGVFSENTHWLTEKLDRS